VACLRAVAVALVVSCVVVPAASAHKGNPNFSSDVHGVVPTVDGIAVEIINRDDSIELRNDSGRTVVVKGYDGEPYVRIAADGSVAVNRNSSAYYLNQDRFAEGVEVPKSAKRAATPDWQSEGGIGRFAWHDHRIHWMSRSVPPQVKDEHKRTKVFDWKVPIEVGGKPAAIAGTLVWVGKPSGGFPLGAALSLAAVILVGGLLVVLVRRRRQTDAPSREAW
jgi:hypothetical protein